MDLLIEGDPAELEVIYRLIQEEVGEEARAEATTLVVPDERLEPLIIGVIVALGGPVVVQGVVSIVKRVLDHKDTEIEAELEVRRRELEHEYRMRLRSIVS